MHVNGSDSFLARFLAHARDPETGNLPAVTDDTGTASYAEVEARSRDLAFFLRSRITRDTPLVAVMCEGGRARLECMLAIHRAGGAWLHLDPRQPLKKRAMMVNESESDAILCDRAHADAARRLLWQCPSARFMLVLDARQAEELVEADESEELWEFFAEDARTVVEAGGWKDAWTGRVIDDDIMDAYAGNTVARVLGALRLEPENARVLEAGCGSGLIMAKLAPLVGWYTGTDIAPSTIRRAMREAEGAGLANTDFYTMQALHLGRLAKVHPEGFDAVFFSSVAQSFPGFGYLEATLDACAALVKPGGSLVFCDVWDMETVEAWDSSLCEFARRNAGKGFQTTFPDDDSLFVPRAFFRQWARGRGYGVSFARSVSETWEMKPYVYDVVLTSGGGGEALPAGEADEKSVFTIVDCECAAAARNEANRLPLPSGDATAYCIFTSGSTGVPKGVLCSRRGMDNFVISTAAVYAPYLSGVQGQHRYCNTYPAQFDAFLVLTLAALAAGAHVFLPSQALLGDPRLVLRYLEDNGIHNCEMTPSRFSLVLPALEKAGRIPAALRVFGFGGENLPRNYIRRIYALEGAERLITYNGYGPTECTVSSSVHFMDASSWDAWPFIPLGRPVRGAAILLVDANLRPVPDGMAGEMLICGANVGQGYLNAPEEEAARFICLPPDLATLAREQGAVGERAYRSGDMARRRKDGSLEFLRRADGQMKVQGYRLETDEIVEALLRCPGIAQACLKLADFTGCGTALTAAYVCGPELSARPRTEKAQREQEKLLADIHAQLGRLLPDYAVPGWIIPLDAIPLSPNGKLNLAALPDPASARSDGGEAQDSPMGETELTLAALWGELLRVEPYRVRARTSFFMQGGYSLLALRLLAGVEDRFGVRMSVAAFFRSPTLRAMAAYLDGETRPDGSGQGAAGWQSLVTVRRGGAGPALCCFHPAGGNVLCYERLAAHLPDDVAVHMLQNPGTEENQPPLNRIGDMAALHAKAITAALPVSVPLVLFGWSMGGLVAWESVRLLRERGMTVSGVVLLDTPATAANMAPMQDKDEAEMLAMLFTGVVALDASLLRTMPRAAMLGHIISRSREAGLYPADLPDATLYRLFDIYAANARAVREYAVQAQDVDTLLIRPRNEAVPLPYMPSREEAGDDYGWKELVRGKFVLREIGGGHNSVLEPPHVEETARHTRDFIQR